MKILVTGSSGLVGSEVVAYFASQDHAVYGIDNNMRAEFFGSEGDTRWNQRRLTATYPTFSHFDVDVRDRETVLTWFQDFAPDLVVHCAAQPSHDLAARRPFDDYDVNAMGTLNILEATRRSVPNSPFVYLSTNKVYGDAPNRIPLCELSTRWDYADPAYADGIGEDFPIDQSKHSLFGVSKAAADLLVQEYGRYFGMYTCCLRGGCLTGPNHSGVELHGFLSYLVKVNVFQRVYTIYGYKGKQVRDNIHALDVARFIACFADNPRQGEVYNLGGGRGNSCSILEAFEIVEQITGERMKYRYVDENRNGDHICYISNLRKARDHYPEWDITISLSEILQQIAVAWKSGRVV